VLLAYRDKKVVGVFIVRFSCTPLQVRKALADGTLSVRT
jgi:hypothetical protein